MATYSKQLLSGSTNGQGIVVAATSTPGTLIHTAIPSTSGFDEVWLYAMNTSASNVKLTVEYGNTNSTGNIELTVSSESGMVLVSPGLILNNSLVIRAFAGTTNAITVYGYVNRIA